MADDPFHASHSNRYTLLAAADINGFISQACERVLRERGDNDSDPTRGTIDQERFEMWVEYFLCPTLGDYSTCAPRSVVVLDNASIHHSDRVVELIKSTGARVIYTAPYSPDLNPIELMFGLYKASLRRYSVNMDAASAHSCALADVTPKKARRFFRKSRVPGSEQLQAESEELDAAAAAAVMAADAAASNNMKFFLNLLLLPAVLSQRRNSS